jgi:hypothetical protein
MVRIVDYKLREKESGEKYYVLVLQGKPEFVRSAATNKMYMTARRASIPTTFDEETCKQLIGSKYVGSIKKVPCDEYEFTIPDSGEVIKLSFRYEFSDEADSLEEVVLDSPV